MERKIYEALVSLYKIHPWLKDKEERLIELFQCCIKDEELDLLNELLKKFKYLCDPDFDDLLDQIVNYIVKQSNFDGERTQIVPMAWADDADSSQFIIHSLKVRLLYKGFAGFKVINRANIANRNFVRGRNQILLVDEFIGTGQTLRIRFDYLTKQLNEKFDLKVCYLVGMENAVIKLQKELNIEIFCPLLLKKGISEMFVDEKAILYKSNMIQLEDNILEKTINGKELKDYSLGFGQAEALFSGEGYGGNSPNSVFPIFWWPQLVGKRKRNPLFERYEEGLV